MAQHWEIGGAGGYGIYRSGTIFSPGGTAATGFRNRFALSAVLCEEMYEHLGGEFRYTYQDGDPYISAAGRKTNLEGQSHAFHYDLLFHFHGRRERIRPYVAAGGGIKQYVVSGPENPMQPLNNIGVLRRTDQIEPLISAGFGVKLRLTERFIVRVDFRDYVTALPKKIITPVQFGNARGLMQQFTPLVGASFVF